MRKCAKATWIGSHGVWKDRYWDFEYFFLKRKMWVLVVKLRSQWINIVRTMKFKQISRQMNTYFINIAICRKTYYFCMFTWNICYYYRKLVIDENFGIMVRSKSASLNEARMKLRKRLVLLYFEALCYLVKTFMHE